MAEVVPAEVLVAEIGDHVVPVGGIPQHGGGDPAAAGPGGSYFDRADRLSAVQTVGQAHELHLFFVPSRDEGA